LASRTTLGLGGPARELITVEDDATLVAALRYARHERLELAILGGGSNVVVSDAGFDGLVIAMAQRGIAISTRGAAVSVRARAGEPWDELVAMSVARELSGLECLSGIPGLVGAAPIQNIGAYGQEVSETIASVRVLDRATLETRELRPEDCGFAYRDSAFKRAPERFAVLEVCFELQLGGEPSVRYAELQRALEARSSGPTLAEVRDTVLALRRAKSMVLDPDDENRHSAGSFFTNPIVSAEQAARVCQQAVAERLVERIEQVPRYPAPQGRVKLAAGWLIERAGFAKGERRGTVGISSRHALALVHHGGGTSTALLALAREIRDRVHAKFGVTLVLEPVLLGFERGFVL